MLESNKSVNQISVSFCPLEQRELQLKENISTKSLIFINTNYYTKSISFHILLFVAKKKEKEIIKFNWKNKMYTCKSYLKK